MSPEQTKKAIEWAQKNPEDPRAQELRRRIEAGTLNTELKAAGLKTFDIKPPKVDFAKATQGIQFQQGQQTVAPTPSESFGDVKEAFGKLQNVMPERSAKAAEGFEMMKSPKTFGQGGFRVLAQGLGGFLDTAGIATELAVKLGMTQEQEDTFKRGLEATAQNPAIQSVGDLISGAYEAVKESDPNLAKSIEDAGILTQFITGGSKPVQQGISDVITAGKEVAPVVSKIGSGIVDKTGDVVDTIRASRVENIKNEAKDAVGRIIQGKPQDIEKAQKALSTIDTAGVKTYKDLNTRFDDKIEGLSGALNDLLDEEDIKRGLLNKDSLEKTTTVGNTTIKQNYVQDSLDQLDELYGTIRDPQAQARIKNIKEKLDSEGLSRREINDLAKEYGSVFGTKAFGKTGEALTSVNARAYENTRKGLKDSFRDTIEGDAAKQLDKQMSDIFATKTLTKKMEIQVNKLYQKVKNRTLAQKLGGAVADIFDLASLGTARGFVQKLLPSNVGLKTANSLDLEKELSKNLAKIEKLNSLEDPVRFADEFKKYIDEVQPGLSTRVTSGLDSAEKDLLLKKLNLIDSQSFVKDGMLDDGLLELQDRIEELKIASEKPKGLTERQYIELRELMDEFEREDLAKTSVQQVQKEQ